MSERKVQLTAPPTAFLEKMGDNLNLFIKVLHYGYKNANHKPPLGIFRLLVWHFAYRRPGVSRAPLGAAAFRALPPGTLRVVGLPFQHETPRRDRFSRCDGAFLLPCPRLPRRASPALRSCLRGAYCASLAAQATRAAAERRQSGAGGRYARRVSTRRFPSAAPSCSARAGAPCAGARRPRAPGRAPRASRTWSRPRACRPR